MKNIFTLLFILVSVITKADQLSYLTLQEAKIATEFLIYEKEIISWCACCSNEKMNLITIQSSYYKKVEDSEDYYQVFIYGKDTSGAEINEPFDLAYLHYNKNGTAVCLGIGLGFKCDPCTPVFKWPYDNSNETETYESDIDSEGFKYVADSKDGSIYSVLIEKRTFNNTEIWVKNTIPIKSVKNSKGKVVKSGGGHALTYMVINCNDKEYTIEEKVTYNSKGDVLKSEKIMSFNNRIVPGSVMSAIYSKVCLE